MDLSVGSWPAIWMMGQNKYPWPNMGEIDIVEVVNGDPSVVESLHSPAHHGGNPQHPPNQPVRTNANLNDYPLIAGMEWNIQVTYTQLILWRTRELHCSAKLRYFTNFLNH